METIQDAIRRAAEDGTDLQEAVTSILKDRMNNSTHAELENKPLNMVSYSIPKEKLLDIFEEIYYAGAKGEDNKEVFDRIKLDMMLWQE